MSMVNKDFFTEVLLAQGVDVKDEAVSNWM